MDRSRKEGGVQWTWDALKAHPLLSEFRDYLKNPQINFIYLRPQVWGYWDVEVKEKPSVIVYYADADRSRTNATPRSSRSSSANAARVLLFTTPMDGRHDPASGTRYAPWNDYAATAFYLVLTNFVVQYMTGDIEDAVFNYFSGQSVLVKWPLDAAARSKTYYLYGPDVPDSDVVQTWKDKESFLRLTPDKLRSAGNYEIVSDPSDKEHSKWRDGFSLNPTADESNLERVPIDQIELLLGDGSVTPADKERKIRDILSGKFSTPIEFRSHF